MKKYRCIICGHVYDPEEGDPTQNILSGTPFENLPDTCVCPICGSEKSLFREVT